LTKNPWELPEKNKHEKTPHERNSAREPRNFYNDHTEVPLSKTVRLIVYLLGIALLIFGITLAFPMTGAVDPYLVRSLVILIIFGAAAAFWSRASLAKIMRVAGLWTVIVIGISFFYLYRSDVASRFMSSLDPSSVTDTEAGMMVHRSNDGLFWVRAELNGVPLRFMVDTGASHVVLSPNDAKRAGFTSNILNFNRTAQTANGSVRYAKATAGSLRLGGVTFYDIPVTVNGAEMDGSLMGMSVLQQFGSFEFRGDTLILRP